MFRCKVCNVNVGPRVAATKLVVETREKTYYDEEGKIEGVGTEIVREWAVCPKCNDEAGAY